MRWRVGGTRPPSVPMSCELPHMKGRNWKSSRPHTPWLPAGSILYVFWSFRITSRYLHGREGKRGEGAKEGLSLNPSVPLGAQGGRKLALRADWSAPVQTRVRGLRPAGPLRTTELHLFLPRAAFSWLRKGAKHHLGKGVGAPDC